MMEFVNYLKAPDKAVESDADGYHTGILAILVIDLVGVDGPLTIDSTHSHVLVRAHLASFPGPKRRRKHLVLNSHLCMHLIMVEFHRRRILLTYFHTLVMPIIY